MGTIIVTGASRGIGLALVNHYLGLGRVVVGLSRSGSPVKHDRYHDIVCDITDTEALKAAFNMVRTQFSPIYALINNAGVASMNHVLLTPVDSVKSMFSLNVFALFQLSVLFSKYASREGGGARIVNLTTVAVPMNLEGEAAYGASKAAVEQLTRSFAKELGSSGITCNAVGPVPIQTDLIAGVPESKIQDLIGRQAIKRFGSVEDVINVIDFYLSERSAMITGQTLYLGGVS